MSNMNESNQSFEYSFVSDLEIKAKITHSTSCHYGCSNCARVLSKSEIINHFESSQGMDDVLMDLNRKCISSNTFDNGNILHNVIVSMACPNCEEIIEQIELLVSGFPEDSKIFENCDTFSLPVFTSCEIHGVVPNSSQPLTFMEISFHPLNTFTSSKLKKETNISLLIIARTKSYNGDCFMGFSLEHKGFYRPIYKESPGRSCWPRSEEIRIAGYYGFKVHYENFEHFNDGLVFNSCSEFPHRINDLVVEPIVKPGNCDTLDNILDLYDILNPYSKMKLEEIFSSAKISCTSTGRCYVYEGSQCASFGILRINLSSLEFNIENENKKPRLCFFDTTRNQRYNLSWTSHESLSDKKDRAREISKSFMDDEALLLIGLGRGWRGKGEILLSQRRCFLLALGLLLKN